MNTPASPVQGSSSLPNQRAERRNSPSLAAYHWEGSIPRQAGIRDISATGAYLLTPERWAPGELITLTLQRIGPPERTPGRRVAVQARAVRWGEDGVGMSFILPAGADLHLWQSPLKSTAEQTEPEDILREFRIASAIAFLRRISPEATHEVSRLLHEGLSNYRLESSVEIALRAERLLTYGIDVETKHAPPNLVMRILEDGSWADDPWVQQLWAGLLATCCTIEGKDESNVAYIDLFRQLTTTHARILEAACTRPAKSRSGLGWTSSRTLTCTAKELMEIAGSSDLIRIGRDLEYLSDLELVTVKVDTSFFSPIADTKISPTSLGLELCARCHGHRSVTPNLYSSPASGMPTSPNK